MHQIHKRKQTGMGDGNIVVPKCQDNTVDPDKFANSEYIILKKISEL